MSLFAESGNVLFVILGIVLLVGVVVVQVGMMIYRPDLYAQMQQHKHEKEMAKRAQRGKALGFAGSLLGLFLNTRR